MGNITVRKVVPFKMWHFSFYNNSKIYMYGLDGQDIMRPSLQFQARPICWSLGLVTGSGGWIQAQCRLITCCFGWKISLFKNADLLILTVGDPGWGLISNSYVLQQLTCTVMFMSLPPHQQLNCMAANSDCINLIDASVYYQLQATLPLFSCFIDLFYTKWHVCTYTFRVKWNILLYVCVKNSFFIIITV